MCFKYISSQNSNINRKYLHKDYFGKNMKKLVGNRLSSWSSSESVKIDTQYKLIKRTRAFKSKVFNAIILLVLSVSCLITTFNGLNEYLKYGKIFCLKNPSYLNKSWNLARLNYSCFILAFNPYLGFQPICFRYMNNPVIEKLVYFKINLNEPTKTG
jgi:hypothetical protein